MMTNILRVIALTLLVITLNPASADSQKHRSIFRTLRLKSSTGTVAPLIIEPGVLTPSSEDGAIEFDGSNLYITKSGVKTAIGGTAEKGEKGDKGDTGERGPRGVAGPSGPSGPQGVAGVAGSFSGGNATINGVLSFTSTGRLQGSYVNGTTLFRNNSVAKFNGSVLIPSNAVNGYVLTSNGGGLATWRAAPAVTSMNTILLLPSTANMPSTNPGIPDLGSNTHKILFDAATDESVNWTNLKISNYQGGAVTAKIGYSMASATSNSVVFNIDVWCVTPGDTADIDTLSFDTVNASAATTVPGTAGYYSEITMTLTNKDSMANEDVCAFRLTRDADNGSDDAAGDAEVRYVKIYE